MLERYSNEKEEDEDPSSRKTMTPEFVVVVIIIISPDPLKPYRDYYENIRQRVSRIGWFSQEKEE